MRYPAMPGNRQRRVVVPKLDGGVNLHDGQTQADDNQLTGCRNMWWDDGLLRCRPGVSFGAEDVVSGAPGDVVGMAVIDDPGEVKCVSAVYQGRDGQERAVNTARVTPMALNADGTLRRGTAFSLSTLEEPLSVLPVTQAGARMSDGTVYSRLAFYWNREYNDPGEYMGVYGQTADIGAPWAKIPESEYYIPCVMVNGHPTAGLQKPNGNFFEGYNLLTPRFKALFTSDGENSTYSLPVAVTDTARFRVFLTGSGQLNDWYEFDVGPGLPNVNPYSSYPLEYEDGNIWLFFYYNDGYFTAMHKDPGTADTVPIGATGFVNNMEVTASLKDAPDAAVIFKMRFASWFGGDRSGVSGGVHLFAGGNPDHPNLVHWSDINRPLYFPENNHAYIGDAGSAVTAFAKQAEKLVIFKEHELYYATYVAGQPYTVDDMMSGRVFDAAAMAAIFPITPLHAHVGCDAPGTIRLCDNRLVWAAGDKRVYMLTGSSQYSESNVMDLSQNIRPALAEFSASDMRAAAAYEYRDCYLLHVRDKVFLFNYRDGSFLYYSYNSAYKQADRKIPWYIWDLSGIGADFVGMVNYQDAAFLLFNRVEAETPAGLPSVWHCYDVAARLEGAEDSVLVIKADYTAAVTARPISCMFRTKVFDFGAPEIVKEIGQVYLGIGAESLYDIGVTWLTDRGEAADAPLRPVAEAAGLRVRRLTPRLRRILRFGIRAESAGAFAVGDMVIKFTVTGGTARG